MSKRLGQVFLKNKEKIRNIVDALQLEDGDTVVEIGPGNGSLIKEMIREEKEVRIIGIEKDAKLAEKLSNSKFVRENDVEIIKGDVLEVLPETEGEYKLVGNIPYYLTGHLLRVLGEMEKKPELIILTIQKEVAERLSAKPPKMNPVRDNKVRDNTKPCPTGAQTRPVSNGMNILGASVQVWGEVNIVDYIPKTEFRPEPEVDSAVVRIIPLNKPVTEEYFSTMKILFHNPRKTILNNLSHGLDREKDEVSKKIKELGLNPKARPENLDISDIQKLSGLAENNEAHS